MSTRRAPGRRSSNVGPIGLGDNTTPSLSTMRTTSSLASQRRQRALSGEGVRLKAGGGREGGSVKRATGIYRCWLLYQEYSYQQSWINPALMLLISLGWFAYTGFSEDSWLHPFICLSYKVPGSHSMYGKGKKDFAFVAYYMLFFTFFREFCMEVILRPLALKAGIVKKSKVHRFMEQTYSMIYYSMSGPFGLYIMYHSTMWFFNTREFYVGFPHRENELLLKTFYLLQAAFWAQQSVLLILQVEKPRKDFYELVFHHIVTMALIYLSYRFHFTRMGVAVYITMDVSDFFLALSKTLNYLDSSLTGPFFTLFMAVWIYSRHYLNIKILYSILTEFKTVGPFELNWETQQYKCWISQYITFALIFALHLVNLYWLFLILRILYRMVFQNIKKDDRSDDEDSEDDETPEVVVTQSEKDK